MYFNKYLPVTISVGLPAKINNLVHAVPYQPKSGPP